jgi:hypothetical protein
MGSCGATEAEHQVQESQKLLWRIDLPGKHSISAVITITEQFGTHHSAPLLSAFISGVNDHERGDLCEVEVREDRGWSIMNIEGFRALGNNIFETVVNKSEAVKETKKIKGEELTPKEKKELTSEEKEYKSKRKMIQEKLIKFATRIPAFMYLTDYRENTLKDVITKIEPELFRTVTGLTVQDFELLVSLGVFNSSHMNQAVFAFRRYEDGSLSYTGIESHEGLRNYGLYDTVVGIDADGEMLGATDVGHHDL